MYLRVFFNTIITCISIIILIKIMSKNIHQRLQFDLGGITVHDIYCINLKTRKDRKLRMQRQAKRRKFPIKLWRVDLNSKDPIAGCRSSHIAIIKDAKKRKLDSILILEDDAQLTWKRLYVPQPPSDDWEMLYLGGDVQKVLDDPIANESKYWKRVCTRTTHAYIVNHTIYDTLLSTLSKTKDPIDVCYSKDIHPHHKCYIVTPIIFSQFNGYSDIEQRHMNYDGLLDKDLELEDSSSSSPLEPEELLDETLIEQENSTQCRLVLPDVSDEDLPPVSIITPTYNRRFIFPLAVRNFVKSIYPKNKLEWVIIDDSDDDQVAACWIPEDLRIKYVRCEVPKGQRLSIGQKRNIGVANSSYDYIVHMDDDDYYYPHNILARVKVLLANKGKQCAFSTMVGAYDLLESTSSFSFDVDSHGRRTRPCEATMIYTRDFWLKHKFNESYETSEGYHFIRGRWEQCVTYPSSFVMVAFQHSGNLTKNIRRLIPAKNNEQSLNFVDTFDRNTNEFLKTIIQTLPEWT